MTAFVITKSGGVDGRLIKYLTAFHRIGVQASSRQGAPASLYDVLASFKHPHLAIAMLEAAWTCPDGCLVKKESSFVPSNEVNTLGKAAEGSKTANMLQVANKLLVEMRKQVEEWLDQSGSFGQ